MYKCGIIKKDYIRLIYRSLIAIIIFMPICAFAQGPNASDKWESFKFLEGDWIGEGSGQPGQGEGGSSFTFDLNSNILIRKSYNNIPPSEDRPAVNHEDLMIIFQDPQKTTRATYWDNEGHVINYSAEFSSDNKTLMFLSEIYPNAPRFKLSYEKVATDTLNVSFEFAPPGSPEEFSLYTSGIIYRK